MLQEAPSVEAAIAAEAARIAAGGPRPAPRTYAEAQRFAAEDALAAAAEVGSASASDFLSLP
jgi:hypothetical protein